MQSNQILVAAFAKKIHWCIPQENTIPRDVARSLHLHVAFRFEASIFVTSKGEWHRLRDPAWRSI
jgi:hypothetical protein